MAKPAAPGLRINRFAAGRWSEAPDAVVTEEPLQLLLDGEPLAVVMRTPGADIELAFGLLFAEGVIRSRSDVRAIRISAESAESEERIAVEPVLMESNHVDVKLAVKPQRKPQRSMLASSACGVCGTQMIDDLRHDLAALPSGPRFDPSTLPGLVDRLRSGQGVFDRTGGLHAAGLFDATGEIVALREDIGRHNAVDKVVGRLLLDGRLPASDMLLVVSGRAGYEIVQKSIGAGIPLLAAVGAPSSLAVALAREFNQTLVGFLRGDRFNVYSNPDRLTTP
ncbi:MAG: formate dehydrogenase family accessory protein FdhD [Actinobacteria bacterium 13_1_20CM_2_65_11]|nr:MAG: formate dehydrogenase family accessory protein FdhD [Chloroflexi bacterium 13_1_40CM_65_17]OLC65000.1 MAG: formate dehydrogenase family accessory protein FdhD [Actinobacteria bacterium 13_1_40CM_4_65_12]OLD49005.1 MAG: formate dehydrogenase family accessory protein FdhD [Actinobacteria bacterium 13_1_40CM_2_65_8]OLE80531.1 MAG: formate dehydrogenase family accessory protein FdhD [Actinobacteria bacterium 13_1_20CM_2_65_11]